MKRAALGLAALAVATLSSVARASEPAPALEARLPLDRVFSLASYGGGEIVVRGSVKTSIDETVYDALMQARDARSGQAPRVGGLFDLEAGGLRIVEQDPAGHVYKLTRSEEPASGCAIAQVPPPCFVPRTKQLALEDLVPEAEFRGTLSGALFAEYMPVSAPPREAREMGAGVSTIPIVATAGGGLTAVVLAFALSRRRKKTPIEEVRAAARAARRATDGDPSLRVAQTVIDRLLERAEKLEEARRACVEKRKTIDVADLEVRRGRWGSSSAPEAKEALLALTAELAEAARLDADLSSSAVGIERIASSLRLLPLRVREHRGTSAVGKDDPVTALMSELETRDQALAEVDAHAPTKP